MANPSSRQGLIDYCLRRLGHPVIEINIDEDQIEDRIDDAFQFYREYHYDAVEMVYLKVQVTPSTAILANAEANIFVVGDVITGANSGATATISSTSDTANLVLAGVTGTFASGELVTGSRSNSNAIVNAVTIGNYDNRYFDIPDAVVGVTRVLPFSNRSTGINIFDIRYQILINDLYSLMSTDLIYYTQVKTQIELINQLLVGVKPIRFNRHMNRLYVDMDWAADVDIGSYMIVECYRILDPDTFTDVYNDRFLKRYATALIKKQWGENMKKFQGVQLPGGVLLNGQQIFDEALQEIQTLEEEMQSRFELPPDMFVG